jgi:hypothetical protein
LALSHAPEVNDKEIPVPILLYIKWAGDTHVINLTNPAIPGMGTYSARALLYRDQYAGTWNGQRSRGQVFGSIRLAGIRPANCGQFNEASQIPALPLPDSYGSVRVMSGSSV